jgi:metal-responsive CopG/Arc/MetJ family transcriptional regulator
MVLVEFKAPIELVRAFDSKSKIKFSSRSEAIRALMRMFIEEMDRS